MKDWLHQNNDFILYFLLLFIGWVFGRIDTTLQAWKIGVEHGEKLSKEAKDLLRKL